MQITKQSLKNKEVSSLENPTNYLHGLNLKTSKVNMTAKCADSKIGQRSVHLFEI